MRRLLLIAGLLTAAPAFAVGVVAPFPRLAQPEGTTPDATPSTGDEDPLQVIERITKAARAVGDKLRDEDSGADTQQTQDQLLKDIDSLLKPPPPMGGGGGGSPSPPMNNDNKPPPQGGDGGGGGSPPPMGNGGQGGGNSSKRPRGDRSKEQGGSGEKPMPMGGSGMKDPMPMGGMPDPKEPPMPGGGGGNDSKPMGGNQAGKGGKGTPPELPLEDPFTKQVWGHLPEKVRQQAMQSYREQFMPRYSEMLKQYYSTLNEKQTPNPSK